VPQTAPGRSTTTARSSSLPGALLQAAFVSLLVTLLLLLPGALGQQPTPRMTNTMRFVYVRYTGAGAGCNGNDAYLQIAEVQVGGHHCCCCCSSRCTQMMPVQMPAMLQHQHQLVLQLALKDGAGRGLHAAAVCSHQSMVLARALVRLCHRR
jgi:hypothetical protein